MEQLGAEMTEADLAADAAAEADAMEATPELAPDPEPVEETERPDAGTPPGTEYCILVAVEGAEDGLWHEAGTAVGESQRKAREAFIDKVPELRDSVEESGRSPRMAAVPMSSWKPEQLSERKIRTWA